jgi:hypothetical protein
MKVDGISPMQTTTSVSTVLPIHHPSYQPSSTKVVHYQWILCACCGCLLRFRIHFALVQCPHCLTLLSTRPIDSCCYQLLYDCEGCGQRLIFPLQVTMVQCSICFMLKSFSPPRVSSCRRCGLRLVYSEKDTDMLLCTVCFGLQPLQHSSSSMAHGREEEEEPPQPPPPPRLSSNHCKTILCKEEEEEEEDDWSSWSSCYQPQPQ